MLFEFRQAGGERFLRAEGREGVVHALAALLEEFVVHARVAARRDQLEAQVAKTPTQKMLHIGVVCTDRNRTKANLQTLFGMERWIEFQIETGVSMEDTTYYGQPCHHAYDNHVGRLGDLCFELITPRSDTCVYDEFLR